MIIGATRCLEWKSLYFFKLYVDLKINYGLKVSRRMGATEILGMFLRTLGHEVGNRLAQKCFQHSGETINRYFRQALDIVYLIAIDIIKPEDPEFKEVPKEILRDSKYMPHFKVIKKLFLIFVFQSYRLVINMFSCYYWDYIGAIDGVHVLTTISLEDQIPYIDRKEIPTQNIMVECSFDLQFIFALAGWEGMQGFF